MGQILIKNIDMVFSHTGKAGTFWLLSLKIICANR